MFVEGLNIKLLSDQKASTHWYINTESPHPSALLNKYIQQAIQRASERNCERKRECSPWINFTAVQRNVIQQHTTFVNGIQNVAKIMWTPEDNTPAW